MKPKRTLALLLALALCLSLCACGSGKMQEVVVGEWFGAYTWSGSTLSHNGAELNTGDKVDFTMSIFKGGAVEIIRKNDNEYERTSTGTWEVSDGVLVITCGDSVISWEIDVDSSPNVLTINGSNAAFPRTLTRES